MSRFGQFHEIPDLPERAFCENKYEFTLEGGGKGGSSSQSVEIPAWAEAAAQQNIDYAKKAGEIGYMPYYGPQVAAFNPTQLAAMQSNIGAAEAFGLVPQGQLTAAQGMPTPTTYAGGFQGYGSGDLYDQAVAEFEKRRPGQAAAYNALFVDPTSSAPATNTSWAGQNLVPIGTPQQVALSNWLGGAMGGAFGKALSSVGSPFATTYVAPGSGSGTVTIGGQQYAINP